MCRKFGSSQRVTLWPPRARFAATANAVLPPPRMIRDWPGMIAIPARSRSTYTAGAPAAIVEGNRHLGLVASHCCCTRCSATGMLAESWCSLRDQFSHAPILDLQSGNPHESLVAGDNEI